MRLMSVHAHPDDESSKGAATMARYVSEGHRVRVVTCTGGERGSILNPRLMGDPEVEAHLAEIRRHEMAAAVEALGVEHAWLGFVDSGLPEGDPLPPLPEGCFALQPLEETVPRLVAQIREFRPQVLVTYNENGGYPHPDHIMTHRVSLAAVEAAADPGFEPELGDPWQVAKVYYDVGFARPRFEALDRALTEAGIESPFGWWLERKDREDRIPTARINCDRWFPQRDAALRAHATQIDPDGFFFATPREIEATAWPFEEFELARATIPTRPMEECLFEGLVATA